MMLFAYITLILILSNKIQGDQPADQKNPEDPSRPFVFYDNFPNAPLQYGVAFLEPRQQHIYPRLQPQLLIYPSGAPPGQQFLLHPGAPPPGNFLIPQPQPQPDVISRDFPPGPVIVARYPKPTHVPPIEKDAEEIPTDPAKVPKFPTSRSKPEKLETFGEGREDKSPDQDKQRKADAKLKPGQRFFILNGQQLFTNYQPVQLDASQELAANARYGPGFLQHQLGEEASVPQNLFLRNSVTGQITDVNTHFAPVEPQQNFVSLNQPQDYKENFFVRNGVPLPLLHHQQEAYIEPQKFEGGYKPLPVEHLPPYGYIHDVPQAALLYAKGKGEEESDDTVVIDAKDSKPEGKPQPQQDAPQEASISQAQPAAVALAGPGGVASAEPRGTALVGEGGLAVSSPQATAVAGPSKDRGEGVEKRRKAEKKPRQ